MDQQTQKIMFSSKSDEYGTPHEFYHMLDEMFKFTLDPCSTELNRRCVKYYTKEDDGLSKSWKDEVVFVNPPYGNISSWVKKSYKESVENNALVVMLIPARTDTKYWHDYIMRAASAIYFVKGRLKFDNGSVGSNPAPFPSVVVVFGGMRWSPSPYTGTLHRA